MRITLGMPNFSATVVIHINNDLNETQIELRGKNILLQALGKMVWYYSFFSYIFKNALINSHKFQFNPCT